MSVFVEYYSKKRHFYHLVDASPWPFIVAFLLKSFALLLALGFHYNNAWSFFGLLTFLDPLKKYSTKHKDIDFFFFKYYLHDLNIYFWYSIILIIALSIIFWFRDVVFEATNLGYHTKSVRKLLRFGFLLFIASEVMFFFSFFWAFFHSSLAPSSQIGGIWPPMNIIVPYCWDLPFLNTILLLSSGAWITAAHYMLLASGNKRQNFDYFYFGLNVQRLKNFVYDFCVALNIKGIDIFFWQMNRNLFQFIFQKSAWSSNIISVYSQICLYSNLINSLLLNSIFVVKKDQYLIENGIAVCELNKWKLKNNYYLAGIYIPFKVLNLNKYVVLGILYYLDICLILNHFGFFIVRIFFYKLQFLFFYLFGSVKTINKSYLASKHSFVSTVNNNVRLVTEFEDVFKWIEENNIFMILTNIRLPKYFDRLVNINLFFSFVLISKLHIFQNLYSQNVRYNDSLYLSKHSGVNNLYDFILKRIKLYAVDKFLFLTLVCGGAFLFCQVAEYYENLFEICDSVYSSAFYLMTGFHGLHVLVGMIFIFIIKFRLTFHHFTKRHHLGLSFSIWYWHFVDIVWIVLFLVVYIWGS